MYNHFNIIILFHYITRICFIPDSNYHFWRRNEVWVKFISVRRLLIDIGLLLYIHFFNISEDHPNFSSLYYFAFQLKRNPIVHHFVCIPFLFRVQFLLKLDDCISKMIFHYIFVCVLLSIRDIYTNKNIKYFQKLMQPFILAEVVSSYFYFRKIMYTKYSWYAMLAQFYS